MVADASMAGLSPVPADAALGAISFAMFFAVFFAAFVRAVVRPFIRTFIRSIMDLLKLPTQFRSKYLSVTAKIKGFVLPHRNINDDIRAAKKAIRQNRYSIILAGSPALSNGQY